MARVALIIAVVAITIFALADWVGRSKKWTPGKLNRWVWLAVIIFLPVVGPLAWIITGLVTRAEEKQRQRYGYEEKPPAWEAPDDNPSAVADIADRIARRQKRSRPHFPKKDKKKSDDSLPSDDQTRDSRYEPEESGGPEGSAKPDASRGAVDTGPSESKDTEGPHFGKKAPDSEDEDENGNATRS